MEEYTHETLFSKIYHNDPPVSKSSGGRSDASSIHLISESDINNVLDHGNIVETDATEQLAAEGSVHSSKIKIHRKRLSGVGKKCLQKRDASNYSLANAIKPWEEIQKIPLQALVGSNEIALTPTKMPPTATTSTYQQSAEAFPKLPTLAANTDESQAGPSNVQPTYKETVAKLVIRNRNCEPMNEEQLRLTIQCINLAISRNKKRRTPKFIEILPRCGWILITSADQYSLEWIISIVAKLKPWPEANLSYITEKDLPNPVICTIFVPSSEASNLEEALLLLQTRNKGLNTENWRVLSSRDERDGILGVFVIDNLSAETLKTVHYRARPTPKMPNRQLPPL